MPLLSVVSLSTTPPWFAFLTLEIASDKSGLRSVNALYVSGSLDFNNFFKLLTSRGSLDGEVSSSLRFFCIPPINSSNPSFSISTELLGSIAANLAFFSIVNLSSSPLTVWSIAKLASSGNPTLEVKSAKTLSVSIFDASSARSAFATVSSAVSIMSFMCFWKEIRAASGSPPILRVTISRLSLTLLTFSCLLATNLAEDC